MACSRNISFNIQVRHFLSCGLGSILLLFGISLSYKISFSLYDYLTSFAIGILTTFFMWTDRFENFNPWLMFLCIGVWQIAMSIFLEITLNKKNL